MICCLAESSQQRDFKIDNTSLVNNIQLNTRVLFGGGKRQIN